MKAIPTYPGHCPEFHRRGLYAAGAVTDREGGSSDPGHCRRRARDEPRLFGGGHRPFHHHPHHPKNRAGPALLQPGGGADRRSLSIGSTVGVGTTVTACFRTDHIDCPPLGDMAGTVAALVQGAPGIETVPPPTPPGGGPLPSTPGNCAVLGPDVSLAEPEVFQWMREYIGEQEETI